MIALLAPGQGAQAPGMLQPWLELDGTEQRLTEWSEITGLDLLRLGTTADSDEIRDTSVTQPLVVANALLAAERLRKDHGELPPDLPVAGHSIGEVAAAALAEVLEPAEAMSLAAVRGREMAAACALEPTGMAAVLGGDRESVLARLEELDLRAANHNGSGQIVAAGRTDNLNKLAAEPPEGSRVRPLEVAGAFHTEFMAPAREAMEAHAKELSPSDARRPMLSNADGAAVTDGAEILRRLVAQVTEPVRWDACMATLAEHGVHSVIELPPAGALAGMVRRELKGTNTVAVKTPAELDKAGETLSSHGRTDSESDS
ncbi:ACP S-malonyltransferase [Actinopolyspora mortivallis]|uniref:ACP S-malonyltransferase n=1 Tax=Actinopolyspora mortivallis TaxID=33906 RepID=UPI0015E5D01C|nr:ACP S-malonyltransferase [Actinopolyspora mortivallis]